MRKSNFKNGTYMLTCDRNDNRQQFQNDIYTTYSEFLEKYFVIGRDKKNITSAVYYYLMSKDEKSANDFRANKDTFDEKAMKVLPEVVKAISETQNPSIVVPDMESLDKLYAKFNDDRTTNRDKDTIANYIASTFSTITENIKDNYNKYCKDYDK